MRKPLKISLVSLVLALTAAASVLAQNQARVDEYQRALQGKMTALMAQGQSVKVNMNDSQDRKGRDVEIRITSGIREFESFAPVAVLEAAALPHKFDAVYIYVRHEPTDRVGRIAFRDADPLAAQYVAGDRDGAIARAKEAIIWH
jgi:hypothetical protein